MYYPVETSVTHPEEVSPGGTIRFETSSDFFVLEPKLKVESFSMGRAKVAAIFDLNGFSLENIEVFSNPIDQEIRVPNLDPLEIVILETAGTLGSNEVEQGRHAAFIVPDVFGEVVRLYAQDPGGDDLEDAGPARGGAGELEGLGVDFGDPSVIAGTALSVLDAAALVAASSGVFAPIWAILNRLEGRLSYPGGDLEYTIAGVELIQGFGLEQDLAFEPEEVGVTIEFAGQEKTGALGGAFEFVVPEDAEGELTGTITYDLKGVVDSTLTLSVVGTIDIGLFQVALSLGSREWSRSLVDLDQDELDVSAPVSNLISGRVELDPGVFALGPRQFPINVTLAGGRGSVTVGENDLSPGPDLPPGGGGTTPGGGGTPPAPENVRPSAAADAATTGLGTPVSIPVLANDSDPDGALVPASVAVATAPAVGSADARDDGTVLYTPEDDPSAGGPEGYTTTFAYTVADDDGARSSPATVTVTVRNAPPAAAAEVDRDRVDAIADRFQAAGQEVGLPPALLAGIASRESRVGNALDGNGEGDSGFGNGIMQVDDRYHDVVPIGDDFASQGHIDQAAGILLGNVRAAGEFEPDWSAAIRLQAGTAAYNAGRDVFEDGPGNFDQGTTGDDYSNDVIARAQYYAENWATLIA